MDQFIGKQTFRTKTLAIKKKYIYIWNYLKSRIQLMKEKKKKWNSDNDCGMTTTPHIKRKYAYGYKIKMHK